MPRQVQGSQWDFSAGEVDVTLKRADNHPARKAGVRQAANFRILNSGAIQNRSGRSALFPEIGRNEKITVQPGVFYFLCFGNGTLHIRDVNGVQVATNSGYSWTTATENSISFATVPRAASVIDVVMTFPGQVPKIARYSAGAWTFLDFAFALDAVNAIQEPFFRLSAPGITMTPVGGATPPIAGNSITLNTSAAFFIAGASPTGMIGTTIRWHNSQILITAVTNSTTAIGTVVQGLPGTDKIAPVNFQGYLSVGDIIVEDITGIEAEVSTVVSTAEFHVNYLRSGTRFKTGAGAANLFGPTWSGGSTVVTGIISEASAIWDEAVTSGFRGWPQFCFYDQGRLGFCNFPSLPRAIGWSAIGLPDNFLIGVTPSAAMLELIGDLSQVLYVVAGQEGNEFVFTDSKIFYIPISVTNPLKPGSVAFNLLSDDGAAQVQPRPSQEVIIYVNAGGNSMKAIVATGAFQRPFNTIGLNDFHSHLINSVVAIAAPHADTTFQERYIYVLNSNGTLAVGKYDTKLGQIQGIVGWVPFSGAGTLSWVTAHERDIFFTTSYAPNGITPVSVVEVLDDSQYLDCAIPVQNVPTPFVTGGKGPLFAFANGSVTLMDQVTRNMGTYFVDANGFIIPQFNGGEDLTVASLVAGQPWTATLEPFAPDAQPGTDMGQRMKPRQVSKLDAYFINSTGFLMAMLFSGKQNQITPAFGTIMNQKRVPAYEPSENQALAPVLREWVEFYSPAGSSYDPRVAIIKDTPGPLLICEIAMEVTI
jgi:hypothetical protein